MQKIAHELKEVSFLIEDLAEAEMRRCSGGKERNFTPSVNSVAASYYFSLCRQFLSLCGSDTSREFAPLINSTRENVFLLSVDFTACTYGLLIHVFKIARVL